MGNGSAFVPVKIIHKAELLQKMLANQAVIGI